MWVAYACGARVLGNVLRVLSCEGLPLSDPNGGSALDPAHDPLQLEGGFSAVSDLCLPAAGLERTGYWIEAGGAKFQDQISWTIQTPGGHGALWHSGGAPYYLNMCPSHAPVPAPSAGGEPTHCAAGGSASCPSPGPGSRVGKAAPAG